MRTPARRTPAPGTWHAAYMPLSHTIASRDAEQRLRQLQADNRPPADSLRNGYWTSPMLGTGLAVFPGGRLLLKILP